MSRSKSKIEERACGGEGRAFLIQEDLDMTLRALPAPRPSIRGGHYGSVVKLFISVSIINKLARHLGGYYYNDYRCLS